MPRPGSLTPTQAASKRTLDVALALSGLVLLSWLIVIAFVAASIDTRSNGFFVQERIGRHGRRFRIVKIRTMRPGPTNATSVTTSADPRITRLGRFLRRSKIDELPQLANVLLGTMSLVGPRPEVPGFADQLVGDDARLLDLRPGITGPATLHFRNEEELLATVDDPEAYNRDVIFPTKVRLNLEYLDTYRLTTDLRILWQTVAGPR